MKGDNPAATLLKPRPPCNNRTVSRRTLTISSPSPQQTDYLGHCLGRVLRAGDVLALEGPLGAGKTCLVRGIARGMGLSVAHVCSPTFVIVNEYTRADDGRAAALPLIHADAYRLTGPQDLDSIGWERLIDGSAAVAVEWPSRIRAALEREPSLGLVEIDVAADDPAPATTSNASPPTARRLRVNVPAAWALRPQWPGFAALADGAASGAAGTRGPTRCRVCGRRVEPGGVDWPFDTPRCRDADLGRWLAGAYVIGGSGGDAGADELAT